jgi:GTPase SAR1 family protein
MISIKNNKSPTLHKPSFTVDNKLDPKLDNIEIFKLMNKSHFGLFLGKAGSGKSSLCISFLNSKDAFKKVFHNVILFCPPNSRASIKDDFWGNNLEPENIYDELNLENLQEVYQMAEDDAQEDFKTLIVLDDVQKFLKGDCEKYLLHMVNNRRHAKLSIWLCCQTYKSIPLQVRQALTDLFVFKVNKNEMKNIFDEQIELYKDKFEQILNKIYKKPHSHLYINSGSQRFFDNWDELICEI